MNGSLVRFSFCSAFTLAAVLVGCDDKNSATVYQTPKESQAMSSDQTPTPPAIAMADTTDAPNWTVPKNWTLLPPQPMRYAVFQVDPADPKLNVIVYTFGPKSGDVLANVQRWEQQINAPVSDSSNLDKVVTHLTNNNLQIDSVDLKGPPADGAPDGVRQLSAIIPRESQVWFLKFVGPDPKVTAHAAEYVSFLQSISFPAAPATPPVAAVTPPPQPAMPAMPDMPAAAASEGSLKSYTLPDGWKLDPQQKPMRLATFHIGATGQQADVIISALPANQFGSAEANINRWRSQVGLDPVADASMVPRIPVTAGGSDGVQFDFPGADAELVVAQVNHGGQTYFFKLTGPSTVVAQQKNAFAAFLKSVVFE